MVAGASQAAQALCFSDFYEATSVQQPPSRRGNVSNNMEQGTELLTFSKVPHVLPSAGRKKKEALARGTNAASQSIAGNDWVQSCMKEQPTCRYDTAAGPGTVRIANGHIVLTRDRTSVKGKARFEVFQRWKAAQHCLQLVL